MFVKYLEVNGMTIIDEKKQNKTNRQTKHLHVWPKTSNMWIFLLDSPTGTVNITIKSLE